MSWNPFEPFPTISVFHLCRKFDCTLAKPSVTINSCYLRHQHQHQCHHYRHHHYYILSSAVRNFESNRIVTSVFDSIRNKHNYLKFLNTYRHRFLTYLIEWRRFFILVTTPSNQQNLLSTMVQVLCLIEVFTLAHYGPPSTETPTTTKVWCHKSSWIYLTSPF